VRKRLCRAARAFVHDEDRLVHALPARQRHAPADADGAVLDPQGLCAGRNAIDQDIDSRPTGSLPTVSRPLTSIVALPKSAAQRRSAAANPVTGTDVACCKGRAGDDGRTCGGGN